MDERYEMRASDGDRQAAIERLRAAHDEGRLDLAEYDARLVRAYQAVTYGDLAALFTDLPTTRSVVAPAPSSAAAPPPQKPPVPQRGFVADMPVALKILWTIYLSIAFVLLTVWFLTSVDRGFDQDFWPIWFTIPGAGLLGVSIGVTSIQRSRRAARLARATALTRHLERP